MVHLKSYPLAWLRAVHLARRLQENVFDTLYIKIHPKMLQQGTSSAQVVGYRLHLNLLTFHSQSHLLQLFLPLGFIDLTTFKPEWMYLGGQITNKGISQKTDEKRTIPKRPVGHAVSLGMVAGVTEKSP